MLELGEGQWFGDVPTATLSEDIDALVEDDVLREELHQRMVTILCGEPAYQSWDLAAANDYTMLIHAYAELRPPRLIDLTRREQIMDLDASGQMGKNSTLYAVMKKAAAASEFRAPVQHVYARSGGFAAPAATVEAARW